MADHPYLPLIEQPDAIRLLLLDPATDHDSPLTGSLFDTTLTICDRDFMLGYIALSYVWGDPKPVERIAVNGQKAGITANLAAGLKSLRSPLDKLRIWVDALCINQKDVPEKN